MSLTKISEKFVLNKLKKISQGNLKLINYDGKVFHFGDLENKLSSDIKIYGFYAKDNPGTVFQKQCIADGHDFAVYQDRYIIDPWAYGVEFIMTSLILDLWDNRLNDQVKHIYGHRDNWKRMHGTERYYVLHQPEMQI